MRPFLFYFFTGTSIGLDEVSEETVGTQLESLICVNCDEDRCSLSMVQMGERYIFFVDRSPSNVTPTEESGRPDATFFICWWVANGLRGRVGDPSEGESLVTQVLF